MELTGPACTEALNGAEEAGRRERAEDKAGGVRVERKVRHARKPELTRAHDTPGFGGEGAGTENQSTEPKWKAPELVRQARKRTVEGQHHDDSGTMG